MPADNVPVTPGSGAAIAVDTVDGEKFQRVKPTFGGDGAAAFADAGTGAAGAGTQRITLATDDALHDRVGPRRGVVLLAPGVDYDPGDAVLISCMQAGTLVLKFADDSLATLYVDPAIYTFRWAIKGRVIAGTTADCSVYTLI